MSVREVAPRSNRDLVLVCRTGDSGLADYAFSLIPNLRGFRSVSFVSSSSAVNHPAKFGVSVTVLFRRFRNVFFDWFSFASWASKKRDSMFLFQSWIAWPFLDALWVRYLRSKGISCSVTAHDLLPHHPLPWSKLTCGFFFRSFDSIVAHSEDASRQLKDFGVVCPVAVVPHGVYDLFAAGGVLSTGEARSSLGINPDDLVVLFFGHLDERKGLCEFLEVAASMEGEGVTFVVAGRNDMSRAFKHVLERTYADNVRLDVGFVPFEKVKAYFSASDVVALPYREGSTSGVLKIAMAFGKPVIASDVGDIPETLKVWPGQLISKDELKKGLVSAIRSMRDDRGAAAEAARTAQGEFGWQRIGERYSEFLICGQLTTDAGVQDRGL